MDNAGPQDQQNSGNTAGIYSQQPTPDSAPATSSSTGFFPHPRPDFKSSAPAGDIILTTNTTKKNSKKLLFIAGAAIAVVLICIFFVFILSGKNQDTITTFDNFSNYIIAGSNSDEENKDKSSLTYLFSIVSEMDEDEAKKYFDELDSRYEALKNVIDTSKNEDISKQAEKITLIYEAIGIYKGGKKRLDELERLNEQAKKQDSALAAVFSYAYAAAYFQNLIDTKVTPNGAVAKANKTQALSKLYNDKTIAEFNIYMKNELKQTKEILENAK